MPMETIDTDSFEIHSSIRSLVRFGRLVGPLAYSVTLPLLLNYPRLVLELFRGERAIARFD